jgi:hypothetical protein
MDNNQPLNQRDISPAVAHTDKQKRNLRDFFLGIGAGILYFVATKLPLRDVIDSLFPKLTIVVSVYCGDALQAAIGVGICLVLLKRQISFGFYLLIGILLICALCATIEVRTQPFWQ